MFKGKKVSVVFPAYNEEGNIANAVMDFRREKVVDEVVVVDNNSKDRTSEFAKKAGARVVMEDRQGYGWACRRAMNEAKGDIIILAEPDGTFSGKDIHKLLAYSGDFDFVLGTRTAKMLVHKGAYMTPFNRWGNWFLGKVIEVLFNGPCLTDVGCTMRLITKDTLKKIEPQFTVGGSHFSPEMMIIALKNRIRTIEVPVNYGARIGTSKITGGDWKAFKLGLVMIRLIISYLFR